MFPRVGKEAPCKALGESDEHGELGSFSFLGSLSTSTSLLRLRSSPWVGLGGRESHEAETLGGEPMMGKDSNTADEEALGYVYAISVCRRDKWCS